VLALTTCRTPDFNDIEWQNQKNRDLFKSHIKQYQQKDKSKKHVSMPPKKIPLRCHSASSLKRPLPHKIPLLTVSLVICASDPETS
jgi:hypothetical protein